MYASLFFIQSVTQTKRAQTTHDRARESPTHVMFGYAPYTLMKKDVND